jgi:hypothetical protein
MKRPKVDRAVFNAQVQRLSANNFWAQLPKAGITELIDTLMRVSNEDEDRARRIIDQALKNPKVPAPADLESISDVIRKSEAPQTLERWYTTGGLRSHADIPLGCEKCEGTGWRFEAERQVFCGCALGRYLRTRDPKPTATERTSRPTSETV